MKKWLVFASVTMLCTLLISCGEGSLPFLKNKKEGYIRYEVTFPYETGLMLQFYPKEMMFYFNEDQAHAVLSSAYGVVSTDFFIGQKDEFFSHYLKSFSEKKVLHMHHSNVHDWLKRYPDVRLESTNETMEIAGFKCKKTIAHFMIDSLPTIDLYSTNEIALKDKNWWNKFDGLDGVLMGYEVNLYGKRMRLRATEVKFEKQDPSLFVRPEGYEEVNFEQMDKALKDLSSSFSD